MPSERKLWLRKRRRSNLDRERKIERGLQGVTDLYEVLICCMEHNR
jgi:hypothetical protein